MASNDQLWFELGVRDNVSKVLQNILLKADEIKQRLKDQGPSRAIYENALKIEEAYDKIAVAMRKIDKASSKTKDTGEIARLGDMKTQLENIRTAFEKISANEVALGTKGQAAFTATTQALSLAITQIDRYTKGIDDASKAEEKKAQDELRRTDALKARYNELERFRKQWNEVMSNLAPGTTLSGSTRKMGQSLDYRINEVLNAMKTGAGMPKSASGADYEKFIRDLKERMKELTAETDKYNNALARNESAYRTVNGAMMSAASQQRIASIRGQRAEYDALEKKVRDLKDLSDSISNEKTLMKKGLITDPFYTQTRVMEEMRSIQEAYNERLAHGKELERQNADAKRASAQAAKELIQANQGLISAYDRVTQAGQRTNGVLQQLQSQAAMYLSVLGAERLIRNVIQIGGEFEVQHIALQSILGDVQQANSMFEQMKELAVVSPFNFRQLASYSKQIAAFGIPYEEMYDTTKRLADMAAGLGVDMGRLILAYGQVRSAAVLRGQELRQFTEAGIPMVKALAEEFTKLNGRAVSTAEVFELISKRAVPFEMVKKVMWDMTNEGGRFFDMQYTLADTLAGKWSNLRDAWEIMLSDFAKGESLSGRMLKAMVQGLTWLIGSMNTLTPLLAGVASSLVMIKSIKWANGLRNLGFTKIDQNVAAAQRLRAAELARQKINGEITRAQYTQLMNMNASKGNYYKILALEGKLNTLQIQRAFKQGDINRKELAYLVQLRIITAEERKQILLGNLAVGTFGRMTFAAKNFFRSLNASLGPIGWISLAIDAVLTTIITISGKTSEINQKNQQLAEGFSNKAKELADSVKSLQESNPTSQEDYKRGIEGLEEMLRQHSASYDAIIRESRGLKTLQEQYEYLKRSLISAEKTYKQAEVTAEEFGDKTRSAFEDVKEWSRKIFKDKGAGRFAFSFDVDQLQFRRNEAIVLDRIKGLADKIREIVPNVGKSRESNDLYRQLRDSMLQELGVGQRESQMIKIRLNQFLQISDGEGAADLVMPEFDKMINKIAPEMANKIRYGKTLNDAEQKKVRELINDAIKTTGQEYPEYASYLQGLLNNSNFVATIKLRFAQDTKASEYQRQVYGNFPGMVDERIKNIAVRWGESGSSYQAANAAKKDIDDAYNELKSREREYEKGKTTAERVNEARMEYEDKVTAALYGYGYDYKGEGKKSNKEKKTSGSKKDPELEAAKTQLEEIKDFYSEYEKYREQYGEEKGLDLVTNIFGMDEERARYIVKNYENEIRKIIKSIEQNGDDARKKFAINGWKLLGEFKLKDDKAKLQKAVDELQRYLQDETSKWNLYKSLLDKTGSKEFAMSAFVDGVEWNDISRNMAERLKESMATRKLSFTDSIFEMDQDEAEKFFGKNSAELKLWEEIVKSIRKNWTDGLNDIAEATSKLMTTEDKIVKVERELAELRGKYGKDDPRVIAKERELDQLQAEAFEQSEPYLKFYSAIFSMTIDEAEKMGVAIKKNLVDQLSKGGMNADKFLKSIRNVDQQLEKIRSRKSFFETFSSGGFSAVAEQNYEDAFGAFSVAAQRVADAEEKRDAARIKAAQAITEEEKKAAKYALIRAEVEKTVSEQQLKEAKARLDGAITQVNLSAKFTRILGEISSVLDVMTDAYDSWREMAEAVDGDVEIDAWAEDMFSIFSSASKGIQKLQSGDIFGALTSTVFGPITALSKNHDARLQKKIENSQRMVRALTNEYQDLQDAMERALGGIYTTGGYDEMYDNLKKQRDEIQKQQDLEYEKKNTDKDKIADYDQQLKELDETMKNYALDMAKALYDIDLHSWASELTDAIVGAWEKGDDAAEAYREKVKDIMKDLTKNILAKKVMEKAFANLGIDEIIANMMDASSGRLDETAIPRLAEALGQAGNLTVDAITKTLDAMEANGTIEREASSSKSSTSNTIKGITENTADLLASYINAIRADVSVNRMTLTEILSAVQGQSELPVIAQAQLLQLEQISSNTLRNALAAEMIYDILHSNVLGNEKFNVK